MELLDDADEVVVVIDGIFMWPSNEDGSDLSGGGGQPEAALLLLLLVAAADEVGNIGEGNPGGFGRPKRSDAPANPE